MELRKFWFGKYKGQNIIDICKTNANYITWCLENVKGFKLNHDEEIDYESSLRISWPHHDNEGSVWEEFDREMTYDMMMDFD